MQTIYIVTRVPRDDVIIQKVFSSTEEATNYILGYFGELIMDIARDNDFDDVPKWFGNFQIKYTDDTMDYISYVSIGKGEYREEIYVRDHEINF